MKTEIKDDAVFYDGKKVGKIQTTPSGEVEFIPSVVLHHKTAERIRKDIEEILSQGVSEAGESHALSEAGSTPAPATNDPEPEQDPSMGDKTPAYVAWFRRNHSAQAFEKRYANRKFTEE